MATTLSQGPRTGHPTRAGLTSVLVPPIAWLASLVLSWGMDELSCSAYASAGVTPPTSLIGTIITVINVVLLIVTSLAGVLGWRQMHRLGATALARFLGLVGVGVALVFGLGIVMIGLPPFFLEVCG